MNLNHSGLNLLQWIFTIVSAIIFLRGFTTEWADAGGYPRFSPITLFYNEQKVAELRELVALAPIPGDPEFKSILLKNEKENLTFSGWAVGDESNPLVICIHGFPDNNRSFGYIMRELAAKGFYVVAPMLRGYETSSHHPGLSYYVVDIAMDYLEMAKGLGKDKFHMVGHDWGAVLVTAANSLYPDNIISATALAVPPFALQAMQELPKQYRNSWYMAFFQLPMLPELVSEYHDMLFIRHLWKTWSPGYGSEHEDSESSPEQNRQMESAIATLSLDGTLSRALGYYRWNIGAQLTPNLIGSDSLKLQKQILDSIITVPTLYLSGADDGCIDTHLFDVVFGDMKGVKFDSRFKADIKFIRVEEAGHWLHIEQPKLVSDSIVAWVSKYDKELKRKQ
eukprot:Clim_evm19s154 gene=Clim_evmTU19s154